MTAFMWQGWQARVGKAQALQQGGSPTRINSGSARPSLADKFTAQQVPKATASPCSILEIRGGLDRMAKGVAQVEEGPLALGVEFVLHDHLAPCAPTRRRAMTWARALAYPEPKGCSSTLAFQETKKSGFVKEHGGLDQPQPCLPPARAAGSVSRTLGIDQDHRGLVKGPHQVLDAATRRVEINAQLAADRGVHHGKQGRGDLHKGDAALGCRMCRHKAAQIADPRRRRGE